MINSDLVFAYGSLIEKNSRIRTLPVHRDVIPVTVKDVERKWNARTGVKGYSTTYLGANFRNGALCNGVIFEITPEELKYIDKRERNYIRDKLDVSKTEWLINNIPEIKGNIWLYIYEDKYKPTANCPIIQSYVDICINGCMQVEAQFNIAKEKEFTKMFVKNTQNWSEFWVNDRIYPRSPHIYTPKAFVIDEILENAFPTIFDKIKIE